MKLFGTRRHAAYAARRQNKQKRSRKAVVAVVILLALLALFGGAFAAWKLFVRPVERQTPAVSIPRETEEQTQPQPSETTERTQETEQEPQAQPEPEPATEQPSALREGVYNILICGTDGDGLRTDTILIAHLDANSHTVALLSIPRDTPVQSASGGLMKINSVYAGGAADGMQRLCIRLNALLGFPVDGYVLVDLEAFQKTVDLVGGVDFEVPQDMDYDDNSQDLHIHLRAGMQHLDGTQAMGLVRYRKGYASQDIQRTKVQQQFLRALAKQCLSVGSLTKLKEFADIFADYVLTDLTIGNMLWFAKELLLCDFDAMQTYTAEGEGVMVNGASYYALYAGGLLQTVNETFNPYETALTAAQLTVISPQAARGYQTQTEEQTPQEPPDDVQTGNEPEDGLPPETEPDGPQPDAPDALLPDEQDPLLPEEELWQDLPDWTEAG